MEPYVKGMSREGIWPDPYRGQTLCGNCRAFLQVVWVSNPDGSDRGVVLEANGQEHWCAITQPRKDATN